MKKHALLLISIGSLAYAISADGPNNPQRAPIGLVEDASINELVREKSKSLKETIEEVQAETDAVSEGIAGAEVKAHVETLELIKSIESCISKDNENYRLTSYPRQREMKTNDALTKNAKALESCFQNASRKLSAAFAKVWFPNKKVDICE